MTQLEQLQRLVCEHYPSADTDIESQPSGRGWLNIRLLPFFFVVEHQPRRGFSFDFVKQSDRLSGFGETFSPPERNFKAIKRELPRLIGAQLRSTRTPKRKSAVAT